ncbi:MAG TPA: CHAT domain-containing protein [Gemmatimonadaceae bacterium]|jgi:CHAT domain-containing protein
MILSRAALAFAVFVQSAPGNAGSPTQIVALATRAVDQDSAVQVREMWASRLRANPNDHEALLGLQILAERQFDFPTATTYYGRLTAPGTVSDNYTAYGAVEHGKTLFSRGLLIQAESTFVRGIAYARAAREPLAEFDATLGAAMARGRTLGAGVELRMLDSLGRAIPKDPALDASWRCERAALGSRIGERTAAPLATQGIALAHRAGDARLEARCTWTLAQDYVRQGDMGTVAVLLTRSETILERVHEHAGLSAMLQWHGYMEVSIANYGRAQQLLQRAVHEAEISGELSSLAWSLVNLSQISLSMNDLASAERRAARAESTFRATGDEWGLATAIGLRGQVAVDIGDTAAARRQYTVALGLAVRDRLALGIGGAHLALADLAVRAGDWPGARRELAAEKAAFQRGGATGWAEGQDFYYGILAVRQGDLREAQRRFAGDMATLDSTQHVRRYLSQAMLAEVLLRQGDTLAAERRLGEASTQLDAWRQTLGDQQFKQLAFQVRDVFGGRPPAIAMVIAGIARSGRVEQAFALAERRRARDLRDRLSRAAGLRVASEIENANAASALPVTVSDVQHAIPDDRTALVEYVAGRSGQPTTVFVITRHTVRARILAPLDSVRDLAARFEALIESGGNVRALAQQLGKTLLQPALADLPPGIANLVVVPDDAVWLVPFQALVLGDGKWAIERYAITTVPAAAVSVMLWQRPARSGPARMLAFGDPRFAGEDDAGAGPIALRAATPNEPLPRLPATAREVRAVARFATDAVIRLRDDASAAFLERAPLTSYRVIHFATHAVTDDNGIAHAGLALAPGDGSDGFVSDGDLAALQLDADLVVLSACHTAGGAVLGGEGVRGLTAPLLQAGARAVLATEWPVDDARTVPLIVAFYTALADGRTTADALREAALGAMRDGAPPREWAAFRLVGDPTVRVPLRQSRGLFGWPWWR